MILPTYQTRPSEVAFLAKLLSWRMYGSAWGILVLYSLLCDILPLSIAFRCGLLFVVDCFSLSIAFHCRLLFIIDSFLLLISCRDNAHRPISRKVRTRASCHWITLFPYTTTSVALGLIPRPRDNIFPDGGVMRYLYSLIYGQDGESPDWEL